MQAAPRAGAVLPPIATFHEASAITLVTYPQATRHGTFVASVPVCSLGQGCECNTHTQIARSEAWRSRHNLLRSAGFRACSGPASPAARSGCKWTQAYLQGRAEISRVSEAS